jgi:hypothetical protein
MPKISCEYLRLDTNVAEENESENKIGHWFICTDPTRAYDHCASNWLYGRCPCKDEIL